MCTVMRSSLLQEHVGRGALEHAQQVVHRVEGAAADGLCRGAAASCSRRRARRCSTPVVSQCAGVLSRIALLW